LEELAPSLLTAEVSTERKFRAHKRWEERASGQSGPIATVNAECDKLPFSRKRLGGKKFISCGEHLPRCSPHMKFLN
jgi:hypothetical protein